MLDTTAHIAAIQRVDLPAPIPLVQDGTLQPDRPRDERDRPTTLARRATQAAVVIPLRAVRRALVRPAATEGHLRTEITIASRRLAVITDPAAVPARADAASSLLDDAYAALLERRPVEGWQLLRAAQCEMLAGLDARGVAIEYALLHGVDALVPDAAELPMRRADVCSARQRLDHNRAAADRRFAEASRSILHRAVALIMVLVLGGLGVLLASPSGVASDALGSITAYTTIVGLGMTGAAVSRVLARSPSRRGMAVASMTSPSYILALRFAFGGVVGLLIVMFLQADLQNLVNVAGQNAYPWAILGGFAERYVDRSIEAADDDALRTNH